MTDHFLWRDHNFSLLIGSFGASAVLLYGVPESKLSQPRNLIGASTAPAALAPPVQSSKDPWLGLPPQHRVILPPPRPAFCLPSHLCLHRITGGQIVSAVVGVCVRLALNRVQWLANAVGMSLALLAMQLTQTTHPPGGATALIACSMSTLPPWCAHPREPRCANVPPGLCAGPHTHTHTYTHIYTYTQHPPSLFLMCCLLRRTTSAPAALLSHPLAPPPTTTIINKKTPFLLPPGRSGFQMVVAVVLGSVELMAVAIIVSNLHCDRAYPTFWW